MLSKQLNHPKKETNIKGIQSICKPFLLNLNMSYKFGRVTVSLGFFCNTNPLLVDTFKQQFCYFNFTGYLVALTIFRMGIFCLLKDGGWGGRKTSGSSHPKICHRYPTMIKLGRVIPYLKRFKKCTNHVTHPLSSADISTFSPEISKF